MNSLEKLQEVSNSVLRILTLIPKYGNVGWHDPLLDIHQGIKRFFMCQAENDSLAEEYSEPGTLKRFLLKRGFMPNNEADAEAILDGIIKENEQQKR